MPGADAGFAVSDDVPGAGCVETGSEFRRLVETFCAVIDVADGRADGSDGDAEDEGDEREREGISEVLRRQKRDDEDAQRRQK